MTREKTLPLLWPHTLLALQLSWFQLEILLKFCYLNYLSSTHIFSFASYTKIWKPRPWIFIFFLLMAMVQQQSHTCEEASTLYYNVLQCFSYLAWWYFPHLPLHDFLLAAFSASLTRFWSSFCIKLCHIQNVLHYLRMALYFSLLF